jgi:hypothetical protein
VSDQRRNAALWWAIGALLLGSRLAALGDARWTSEESWFFGRIVSFSQGAFGALGTPVSGTEGAHPGPWFFASLAPFAWLWAHPWAVAFGVALLDTVGRLLALFGIARLAGRRSAWATGIFLALSPWALLYADRPWNSNLVSLPVGLTLWGLAHWWRSGSTRGLIAIVAGLGVMPSFHMSAPILGLPVALLLGRRWRQLNRRSVAAAALAAGLIWAPYIAHEVGSGGANTRALLTRNEAAVSGAGNTLLALSWPLRMISPEIGYHAQKGFWPPFYAPAAWRDPGSRQGRDWWAVHGGFVLVGVLLGLALGVLALLDAARRVRWTKLLDDPLATVAVVGTLSGWALLLLAQRRAFPHYLHPLLPLYGVLVGGFVVRAIARTHGIWRFAVIGGWALILASGLVAHQRFQGRVDAPFGLRANLQTLDALAQLGDQATPRFCGALRYRSGQQLRRIAEVTHPQLLSDGRPRPFDLLHFEANKVPPGVGPSALWSQREHSVDLRLVRRPLPRSLGALGCR